MHFSFLKILFFFFILLTTNFQLFSQVETYHSKFYDILSSSDKSQDLIQNKNYGIYNFYKTYISSQDHKNCPYHPSCSEYAVEAIKKNGIILGLIKGFDRLSRCNTHQIHQYQLSDDHKMIDYP